MPAASWSRLSHLLLLCLSLVVLPLTHAAREPYNISVSDQSPTITYSPSRSGPSSQTWNATYTDSPWSEWMNQTIGEGTSSHFTTHVGANASLGWWGTAVYLWADASENDAQVTIDGSQTAKKIPDGWMLDGLPEAWHRVRLSVTGTGGVNLKGITFTTGLGGKGATTTNSTVQAILSQSQIDALFHASTGEWNPATQVGGAGNQVMQTYNRLDTHQTGAQLIFQPPQNTSFVLIYGSANFDHGQYQVSLTSSSLPNEAISGDAADTTTATTTIGGVPSTQQFRGVSPWITVDQVLYYANLDTTAQYTLTVLNQGGNNPYWDVSKVVFIQAQGGDGSDDGSSSNTAAIAGGAAGGAVALILIGILAWFFLVRKKKQSRKRNQTANLYEDKPFEVDPYHVDGERNATDAYANAASGSHTPYDQTPPHGMRDSTVTPLLLGSAHSPDPSWHSHSQSSPNPNRLSASMSEGYGYYPSTSSSSRHNSMQPSQEGGMVLHNPDDSPGRPRSDSNGNTSTGGKSRYINDRQGQGERRRSNIVYERDAGSVPIPASQQPPQEVIIPPSYDPSWAMSRNEDSADGDGGSTHEEPRSPPIRQ
ncbi:uncharacterized protein I303_108284 [Kwoniella dejecticola CBS 10117]|uniref:Dystroglycan-type cadherin-like domain-containing protein n=1 Tax=Kwoniella dejecticola CBS 10117 TaxID=1296121 RepID=A0A1A5ZXU5_9TREE|nr:uncharacterized protein I303_07389 [Kwoniella dejecticola CBS 10117]OBR82627.1 hypothetical protein I303_07389 [Kwoniella dejecticola CBS 10117]